jgi:hypothetical protein
MTDHLIADLQDEFVVLVELKKLGTSHGLALEDPEIAFRIERD